MKGSSKNESSVNKKSTNKSKKVKKEEEQIEDTNNEETQNEEVEQNEKSVKASKPKSEKKERKSTKRKTKEDEVDHNEAIEEEETEEKKETATKRQKQQPKKDIEESGSQELFVGSLPFSVDEEGLRGWFESHGITIQAVRFTLNPDGTFWGSSFVQFASKDIPKAIKLDQKMLDGRKIRVQVPNQKARPTQINDKDQKQRQEGSNTVFIGRLPYEEDDIREYLIDCGDIQQVRMVYDKRTQEFSGCAFVVFNNDDGPDNAVELNGSKFRGRSIRIAYE